MSNDLLSRQSKVLAQGETSPNSKRQSAFIQGVYPSHLVKGEGCYVWDQNGKRYIDFISGLGTNLLGYAHPKVTEAVRYAAGIGSTLSLPHPIEIEVAELIRDMIPCAEKVRFLKTGNEATLAAVRIARAYNRERSQAIMVEGYHGHGDLWTILSPPAIGVSDHYLTGNDARPFPGVVEILITEPRYLDIPNIERVYQEKRKQYWIMVMDEIVTGFRVQKYTVSTLWDIQPELICLGKGIANGFPLSVVAGKKSVMDCDEYFISSTFSGEIVSLYAAKAVLEFLRANDPKIFWDFAESFKGKINEVLKPIDVKIGNYATHGILDMSHLHTVLMMQEACKAGILLGKAWFPCWAHMEAGIEETVLTLLSDIVSRIKQGKVKLEGKMPVQTFVR